MLDAVDNKVNKIFLSALPHDFFMIEILPRLPVKTLLRFKCVSKCWKSLISSSYFVKKHLSYAKQLDSDLYSRVILSVDSNFNMTCSLSKQANVAVVEENMTYSASKQVGAAAVEPVQKETWNSFYRVVGSHDGLVCGAMDDSVLLWNPSIRVRKKLPKKSLFLQQSHRASGFSFTAFSNDYKVVSIDTERIVAIYSLRENSWRRIKFYPYNRFSTCPGEFVNGAFHWTIPIFTSYHQLDSWVIVSLDLATETFNNQMSLPPYEDNIFPHVTLGVLEGCLSAAYHYRQTRVDFWAMTEYGVKDSWKKLATIPYLGIINLYRPLYLLKNGDILFLNFFRDKSLLMYDSKENSLRDHIINGNPRIGAARVYIESLVSPTIIN